MPLSKKARSILEQVLTQPVKSDTYVTDEALQFDISGVMAKADWYPIVPGTVRLQVGSQPKMTDNGDGTVLNPKGKAICVVDYKRGQFAFVHPVVEPVTVSYDFDNKRKAKPIKMILKSEPIKAQVRKMDWKLKPPTDPNPIDPKLYFGHNGESYNADGVRCCGYTNIPVLAFLWGRRFDEVVMGYIHGLRPSTVRVSKDGGTCCDCRRWRVTIYTDRTGKWVESIHQEIEVHLPEGVAHGDALRQAQEHGIDSPQVKWHADATGYAAGLGGYRKTTASGKSVPWTFKSKRNSKLWRTPKK